MLNPQKKQIFNKVAIKTNKRTVKWFLKIKGNKQGRNKIK